jgi:hypothetical protein
MRGAVLPREIPLTGDVKGIQRASNVFGSPNADVNGDGPGTTHAAARSERHVELPYDLRELLAGARIRRRRALAVRAH